jgi:hypothetical protein
LTLWVLLLGKKTKVGKDQCMSARDDNELDACMIMYMKFQRCELQSLDSSMAMCWAT